MRRLLVHPAHAAALGCGCHGGVGLGVGLVGDQRFGRQDAGGDGRGVLQSGARDLGRVDDAGRDHVAVRLGVGVVAIADLAAGADLVVDDGAVDAGILGDLADRGLQRSCDDLRAGLLVAGQLCDQLLNSRESR